MRLTQGTFSFLPDLTDDQIRAQIAYCLDQGWSMNIEYTDDPHPRNTYWELFGLPMFDQTDPAAIMAALAECRAVVSNHYIRLNAFDRTKGRETVALSILVGRPAEEPGFTLARGEGAGRAIRYTVRAAAGRHA